MWLLKVVRPQIILGGFLGYLLGVLLALPHAGIINFSMIMIGYVIVLFCDLSTHFSNDLYDVESDAYASTKVFGHKNYLVDKPFLIPAARLMAVTCTLLSISFSVVALTLGAPFILLLITIVANIIGWLYSAPPVRLSSRGFGEMVIALGTGLGVPSTGYLMVAGRFDVNQLTIMLPLVLYGFILSLSLELPDASSDYFFKKMNLVVRLGRNASCTLILLSGLTAPILWILLSQFSTISVTNIIICSLPPTISSLYCYRRRRDDKSIIKVSKVNVLSLFIFLIAINGWLLFQL